MAAAAMSMLALGLTQTVEHFWYQKSLHPPLGGSGLGVLVAEGSRVDTDPHAFAAWIASLREATRMIPEGCQASVPRHVIAHVPHQWGFLDYEYEALDASPPYVLVDANIKVLGPESKARHLDEVLQRRYRVAYQKNGVLLYELAGHALAASCPKPLEPGSS